MTGNRVLMICCAGLVAASGCAVPPTEDAEGAESDVTARSEGAAGNAIGAFHLIRVANTQLCLQPKGGSTGDVPIELAPCNPAAGAQNWLFVSQSGGREVVNQLSGKCLRYDGVEPPANGGSPITHTHCNVFNSSAIATNSLWKASSLTGFSTLTTQVGHRDTGFCLDVPGGNAFPGASLFIWQCNGLPQQTFVVGTE